MHAIFLYHCIQNGMDMGIVNAGAMPIYEDIPQPMRKYAEEVVLNKSEDGKHVERLLAFAEEEKERKAAGGGTVKVANKLEWREKPIKADHLTAALAAVPRRATSPSPLRPAARGAASLTAARLALRRNGSPTRSSRASPSSPTRTLRRRASSSPRRSR